MNKQTFPIPEGCKAVTVEQVGNRLITTFEPTFKRGDVLISKNNICFIFRPTETDRAYYYFMHDIDKDLRDSFSETCYCGLLSNCRHATPDEAQRLWDALAKEGKRWNPETMQVEDIEKKLWRGEKGFRYFYFDWNLVVLGAQECECYVDKLRYNAGNYFRTREQAQRAAYKLKAALSEFWKEELK